MRESRQHDPYESDPEVLRELQSEMHPDWELLSAPLDRPCMDAMIDQAIARRGRGDAGPAKVSFLRPRRWLPALAFGGALAAGLSLVLRTDDPVEPFALEMRPGSTQVRGDAPRGEANLYDLRNEPLWTAHAPAGTATDELRLYLVAQTASGTALLRPEVERKGTAFRVLGELGDLGLRPGDVTLHFVLGPATSDAEVLSRLEAHLAGASLPSTWQVQSRAIHIKEG